jgi:hypothetical protein
LASVKWTQGRARNQEAKQPENLRIGADLIENHDLDDLKRTSSYLSMNTSAARSTPKKWPTAGTEILFSISAEKQMNMS